MSTTPTIPRTAERRSAKGGLEYRAAGDTPGIAAGYAAVFGVTTTITDWFDETIEPGAFNKTLQEADVLGLWQHDTHQVLGRSSAGTLRLSVDDKGLAYEIDLPPTSLGRDAAVLLERGDVRGSSFGFRAIADRWVFDGERDLRILTEVALFDVSVVTNPAYPEAEAALRSLAEARSLDAEAVLAAARTGSPLPVPTGAPVPTDGRPVHRPPAWLY